MSHRWEVLAASLIGSVHVRDHRPLQDSARTWNDAGCAVIAVADGHGHHAHFRSEDGADLATRCALDVVRAALPRCTDVAAARAELPELARAIVESWTAAVHEHLSAHPLDPGLDDGDPLRPYGSTLTVVALAGGVLLALQIGDGDAIGVRVTGEAFRPLPEDPRHDGVLTTSLCQPDAVAAVRHVALDAGDENLVLAYVCTDGFSTSRVDTEGWWQQTGAELLDFSRTRGLAWVAEQLPSWLEEPAQIGGDDTTLAIIARADL